MPNPPKLYTARGETLTIKQLSAKTSIPVKTINARLKLAWSIEDAVGVAIDRRFRPKVKPVKGPTRPCPVLKKHKATNRACCEWQSGGERHVRYFGKIDSAEAEQGYARFQLEWATRLVKKSPVPLGQTLLVCELVEQWLDYCETGDDGESGYRNTGNSRRVWQHSEAR
ncbi:hypothetical protein R5W23_000094 [Gemmata sp. JC673]|uniref:Uncharacterized protein n=1 Tax=Gemmata algarum TaxID=2975278 RepID=A0ABU5ESW7_9BACT|nr:hypothetical protein [Gemmata algarum]MDY3557567.1 hypothetical protein [Gemmata algarum]